MGVEGEEREKRKRERVTGTCLPTVEPSLRRPPIQLAARCSCSCPSALKVHLRVLVRLSFPPLELSGIVLMSFRFVGGVSIVPAPSSTQTCVVMLPCSEASV